MNHIAKNFETKEGRVYKSHSWELREGGYRRAALIVGHGLWPVSEELKLIGFLLDRGFLVISLEVAYGSSQRPRLSTFREAVAAFAEEAAPVGLPLYILASSFSASALLPVAEKLPEATALALISPIVDFPPPGLKVPLFFWPSAELPVETSELSGAPEGLTGLLEGKSGFRFRRRDLKDLAAELMRILEAPLGLPTAAFAGEDDHLLPESGRRILSEAGIRVYSYPRVKREPGHDRYVDNFYADLGSFLDEVEAGRFRS
jgi:hypothetical protein